MSSYAPPLRDIGFVLRHVARLDELVGLDDFAHVDPDVVDGLLAEVGRFCAREVAPTNREGDRQGSELSDGRVTTPESFGAVYDQYVAAGWGAVQHPREFGGGEFPLLVANAVKEMITSANMAFSLCPLLTTATVVELAAHGSEDQRRTYLPKLVTGEWAGTMNLTEPQAGSDVGALTTRAEPAGDGTYRITGQKIFITYGEHDLTDQIVHLVLARLPDAPAGTKGISLFLVPKYLVEPDGSLGERNDVRCVGIEHKLGIHASPTCVMAYGEQSDGAVGELVGEPNEGMRQMFTMMNDARLGVGLEGVAIAERAYQQAIGYARQRRQGSAPGSDPEQRSLIVEHADVRRMLLRMRALTEASRALCYLNARAIDMATHHPEGAEREHNQKLADLLTPLSKAWSTDRGVEVASLNVQVHGGTGYIEESGAPQHLRDARIAPIYEGTNGIQAMDLVGRKLGYDDGRFVLGVLEDAREEVSAVEGDELRAIRTEVLGAIDAAGKTTRWLLDRGERINDVLAAGTPYLEQLALTVGGWLLARGAAAAKAALDAGAADGDKGFYEARIVVARFYATQLLPRVETLRAAATAGAGDLFALSPDQLD